MSDSKQRRRFAFAVDLSNAQAEDGIRFDSVKADGIGYAWLKRGEGSTPNTDMLEVFGSMRTGCRRAGIAWGAYHFTHPARSNCFRHVHAAMAGGISGTEYGTPALRQMFDVEPAGTGPIGWGRDHLTTAELGDWASQLTALWERPCLIYFTAGRSYAPTLAKAFGRRSGPGRVGLWPSCRPPESVWRPALEARDAELCYQRIVEWAGKDWPYIPAAIQFSSSGQVDGIDGPVDLDVIDVDACSL